MTDLIARAEAALQGAKRLEEGGVEPLYPVGLLTDLVAGLKAAHQENERLGWFLDRLGFPSPERDAEIERRLRE